MDIVSRLIAFRDYKNLSNSQFADSAGIPRPTLSQFLNGRNKRMSDDLTSKIHAAFPDLNILWLLFGEGNMLMDGNIETSEAQKDRIDGNLITETPENKGDQLGEKSKNPVQSSDQNSFIPPRSTEFGRKDCTQVFTDQPTQHLAGAPVVPSDPAKKIQSIMVFYSDSSFEIFTPSGEK